MALTLCPNCARPVQVPEGHHLDSCVFEKHLFAPDEEKSAANTSDDEIRELAQSLKGLVSSGDNLEGGLLAHLAHVSRLSITFDRDQFALTLTAEEDDHDYSYESTLDLQTATPPDALKWLNEKLDESFVQMEKAGIIKY